MRVLQVTKLIIIIAIVHFENMTKFKKHSEIWINSMINEIKCEIYMSEWNLEKIYNQTCENYLWEMKIAGFENDKRKSWKLLITLDQIYKRDLTYTMKLADWNLSNETNKLKLAK